MREQTLSPEAWAILDMLVKVVWTAIKIFIFFDICYLIYKIFTYVVCGAAMLIGERSNSRIGSRVRTEDEERLVVEE